MYAVELLVLLMILYSNSISVTGCHIDNCFYFQGGFYLFNIVDNAAGGYPLLIIGLFEILSVSWVYGK